MINLLKLNTLLDSEIENKHLAKVIVLRLGATWLEGQDWVTNPYGGHNPAQELLFRTHVLINDAWKQVFLKNKDYNRECPILEQLTIELSELCPELKSFFHYNKNL
jgi:hypothetical protein